MIYIVWACKRCKKFQVSGKYSYFAGIKPIKCRLCGSQSITRKVALKIFDNPNEARDFLVKYKENLRRQRRWTK